MADFNLELAFNVVHEFKGNQEELQPFLKIVKIINDSLKVEERKTLIGFITNVKLNYLARTTIEDTTVATYEILKEKLTERYRSHKTLAQIQFKLSKIHQYNDNIRVYSDKISKLIDQLNEVQIRDLKLESEEQKNNVKRANKLYSLNIFKQGLNDKFSSTVFTAQPKAFNEAINLALELETQIDCKVLFYKN